MVPPVDIASIAEEVRRYSEDLELAFEERSGADDTDPRVLLNALGELFDGLRVLRPEGPLNALTEVGGLAGEQDVQALGNYGIDLLGSLSALAGRLHLPQQARAIEELSLPLACWVARQGGEVSSITPVVNGAASLANKLKQPTQLEQLHGQLADVVNAVAPRISQDTGYADPTRPWRVLLFNRAIVATRSHQPALMEQAFASLVENLPDEAHEFFREGIEQMEALDYPPNVRAVMQRYYDRWCKPLVLH